MLHIHNPGTQEFIPGNLVNEPRHPGTYIPTSSLKMESCDTIAPRKGEKQLDTGIRRREQIQKLVIVS
jgi:hypothetical protein